MTNPLKLVASDSSSSPEDKPKADLVLVPRRGPLLMSAFGEVHPYLQRSLERTGRLHSVEEILGRILLGDSDLWVAISDEEVIAAIVTRIMQASGGSWCVIEVGGGKDMNKWIHFIDDIERWAKANGCSRMQVPGRRGWGRALGYETAYVVHEKELT